WAGDGPLDEVVAAEAGKRSAHVIPFGGSSPASIQGYVDCGRELRAQVPDIGAAEVVVAVGSGGTMAGLLRDGTDPADLRIDGSQVGAGYATLTGSVRAALELTARVEGIYLDPTY